MKKSFLIKVLSLIVAVTAVFGLVGINANVVDAAVLTDFNVKDGARISTTSVADVSALRFEADLYQADYNEAVSKATEGQTVYFGIQVKKAGTSEVFADSCYTGSKVGNGVTIVPTFADAKAPYTMYNKITFNANLLRDYLLGQGFNEGNVDNAVTAYLAQAYTIKLEAQAYYKIGESGAKVMCGQPTQRSFHTVAYATQLLYQAGKEEFPELPENFFEQYTISVEEGELYFLSGDHSAMPKGLDLIDNKIVDFTLGEDAGTVAGITVDVANYGKEFAATYTFGDVFFNDDSRAVGKPFSMFAFSADKKVYELSCIVADRIITDEEEFVDFVTVDADYDSTGYTVLANHLDLTGYAINHTSLVKSSGTPGFSGTFDGFGHTIDNFDATKSVANVTDSHSKTYHLGIFGAFGAGAVIKNFALTNVFASNSQYLAGHAGSNVTLQDIYIDIRPETVMPLGLADTLSSGSSEYVNVVIHYPANHETLQAFGYALMRGYGVLAGDYSNLGTDMTNVYVISPSPLYKTYSSYNKMHTLFYGQAFANNYEDGAQEFDTILQVPIYGEDGKTIIGGETLDYNKHVNNKTLWKSKDSIGYWDEETQTFTFDNSIYEYSLSQSISSNCSLLVCQHFDDYSEFKDSKHDHTGKIAAAFNVNSMNKAYWQLVDNVPYFKNVNASNSAFVSKVTLSNQTDNYTITTTNDYTFTLTDSFGNNVEDFTVTSSNTELLVANGKTITAKSLPTKPTPVKVTLNATINGEKTFKEVIVVLKATTTVVDKELFYSELDKEFTNLSTHDIQPGDVTGVFFVDENKVLQELSYADGKLTGISLYAFNALYAFGGVRVDLIFKNGSSYRTYLSATNGSIEQGMPLVITTANGVYEFTNVIPAYKVIDEESELELSVHSQADDPVDSGLKIHQSRYFVIASDIKSDGSYKGASSNVRWSNSAFDGRGHSLIDFNITQGSILGLNYSSGGSIGNFAVINLTATNAYVISNATGGQLQGLNVTNIYCEFNKNSSGSGLFYSTHYGIQINNVVIVDNTPADVTMYPLANTIGQPTSLYHPSNEIADNVYVVSTSMIANSKYSYNGTNYPKDTLNNCDIENAELVNTNYYFDGKVIYDKNWLVERYNSYSDFTSAKVNVSTFTNESGSKYWRIANNVPVWHDYYASAGVSAFTEISLTGGGVKQTENYLITDPSIAYAVKLVDSYGYEYTNLTLETNNDILSANGNVLQLTDEVDSKQVVVVTVTGDVNGDAFELKISITLDELMYLYNKDVYYSEQDEELMLASTGFDGEITTVYYVDANGAKQELNYAEGKLTGVKTSVSISSYANSITNHKVTLTYKGSEEGAKDAVVTLAPNATGLKIADRITLIVEANGDKYKFTNVLPVYKVINEETELNIEVSDNKYYHLESSIVSEGKFTGSTLFKHTVDGSEPNAYNAVRQHILFDGNGNSISNLKLNNTYGLFGGSFYYSIFENFALYIDEITHKYSGWAANSMLLCYDMRGVAMHNMYLDINPTQNFSGLSNSMLHYNYTVKSNNVIINYPTTTNNGNSVLLTSNNGDTFKNFKNYYVISKNYLAGLSGAYTPTGGEAEESKSYGLDGYNNYNVWTDNGTLGSLTGRRNAEKTAFAATAFSSLYRYDTLAEFKAATGNNYTSFTGSAGNGCWTMFNGVPMWHDYYSTKGTEAFEVSLTAKGVKQTENYTINEVGVDYTVKLVDKYGNEFTNITLETNNPLLTISGNVLQLTDYVPDETIVDVLVSGSANSDEFEFTIPVKLDKFTIVYDKEVYYSEADSELRLGSTGIKVEDIKGIYYYDENNVRHQLSYDVANNSLTGITTSVTNTPYSTTSGSNVPYRYKVSSYKTTFTYNDNTTKEVSLDVSGCEVTGRLQLVVYTDSLKFVLNNVLPVYKVIDTESEFDIPLSLNNKYYLLDSDIVSTSSNIIKSRSTSSRNNIVFDGNGHYFKDGIIYSSSNSTQGMFGGYLITSLIKDIAFINLKVTNSPLFAYYHQRSAYNNVYIDINKDSTNVRGLVYSLDNYYNEGFVSNNMIINYPVDAADNSSIISNTLRNTTLTCAENTYVISKNYLGKLGMAFTPTGETAEASKTYFVDSYNKKSDVYAIEGKAGSYTFYRNADSTVVVSPNYQHIKRYDNIAEFKNDSNDFSSFTGVDGNNMWTIIDGIPQFKHYVNETTITLKDSGGNVVTAIDTVNADYTLNVKPVAGSVTDVVLSSESEYISIEGNTITAISLPISEEKVYVNVSYNVNGEAKTDTLVISAYLKPTVVDDKLLYSEADDKLLLSSTGIEDSKITEICYVDDEGEKHRLDYKAVTEIDEETGLPVIVGYALEGIKTTVSLTDKNKVRTISSYTTKIFYAGNQGETEDVKVTLTNDGNVVNGSITLYVIADSVPYMLTNVLPVYQAIDEESDLDIDIDVAGRYYMLSTDIVSDGATYTGTVGTIKEGSSDKAVTRSSFVFDGNGHYIKDLQLKKGYGILGYYVHYAIVENFALYNTKVHHVANLNDVAVIFVNPRGTSLRNIYLDITADSEFTGIIPSTETYGYGYTHDNIIVNYPTTSDTTGKYVLSKSYGANTTLNNVYFITMNKISRMSLALTPNGGELEASKTYIIDSLNNKGDVYTQVCTASGKTYYRNAEQDAVVADSFGFKRYTDITAFKAAQDNNYNSFTGTAGYGCWTLRENIPTWTRVPQA